jgi:hypothetical protein
VYTALLVGWDRVVGIAAYYGLDGPGIKSPVAERSVARVCGRSLARVEGSNPDGAWVFVL